MCCVFYLKHKLKPERQTIVQVFKTETNGREHQWHLLCQPKH